MAAPSKHTRGPWTLAFQRHAWAAVDSGIGFLTSPDHDLERISYEERLANARLMAAAPDYAAATETLRQLEVEDETPGPRDGFGSRYREALRALFAAHRKAMGP